jgi:hypothetical protein
MNDDERRRPSLFICTPAENDFSAIEATVRFFARDRFGSSLIVDICMNKVNKRMIRKCMIAIEATVRFFARDRFGFSLIVDIFNS